MNGRANRFGFEVTMAVRSGSTPTFVIALLLLAASAVLGPAVLQSAEGDMTATVVVLPFEVSADGRFSYLNRSVDQMVMTRLSRYPELRVRPAGISSEQRQMLRARLQAGDPTGAAALVGGDWVVDPGLYSLRDGMQMNLTIYPLGGGKAVQLAEKIVELESLL